MFWNGMFCNGFFYSRVFLLRFLIFEIWSILYSTFIVNWSEIFFRTRFRNANHWYPDNELARGFNSKSSGVWVCIPLLGACGAKHPYEPGALGGGALPNMKKFWIRLSSRSIHYDCWIQNRLSQKLKNAEKIFVTKNPKKQKKKLMNGSILYKVVHR